MLPGVEIPRRGRGGTGGKRISEILKPGQEVVVQVIKDPLKTKGARLSMELTIAGRYMVYAPDRRGRRRLQAPGGQGARAPAQAGRRASTSRAAARSSAPPPTAPMRADFERELPYLFKLHEVLQQRVEESRRRPALVFQEADLSVRVVRDIFSADFERAIVDDEKQYQRLVSFFTRTAPELLDRVELTRAPSRCSRSRASRR